MSITIVNPFEVPKGKEKEAIAAWDEFGKYFSKQEGYISAKLLESVDENADFHLVTIAEWSDKESFNKAVSSKELEELADRLPSFKRYPNAYRVIRNA